MGQNNSHFCSCKNNDLNSDNLMVLEDNKRNEGLVKHQSKNLIKPSKYAIPNRQFIQSLDPKIQPIAMGIYAQKITSYVRLLSEKKKMLKKAKADEGHANVNDVRAIKTADFQNSNFKYIGNKQNTLKEGFGIQIWKDAKYFGFFHLNKAEGLGLFEHVEGDKYLGEFFNDKLHGYGVYTHNNGATYEGTWREEYQDGKGIETWKDGSYYQGDFFKGKKHGIGQYLWCDGSRYEGEWSENSLSGFGIYYFNDDRIYYGQWDNNMMNGLGKFVWKDGKVYYGYYLNDKKEGFGIYSWSDVNKIFLGFWRDGKQNGIGKYMDKKKSKLGYWANGKKKKWLSNDEEAQAFLEEDQKQFYHYFSFSFEQLDTFK